MKLTTLLENTAVDPALTCQHGLSQYLEVNGRRILFDAGPSAASSENAEKLGVDLEAVDTCVLSHGHHDHADGLPAFLERNTTAPVYLKPEAQGEQMGMKKDGPLFIGVDPVLFQRYGHRLRFVSEETDLGDGIVLLTHITRNPDYAQPQDDLLVKTAEGYVPDGFLHELILTVREGDGIHILTGCSHSGIVGMIETVQARFPGVPILSVTGGFHLMVVPHQDRMNCTPEFARALGEKLRDLGDFPVFTCHCTGQAAFDLMKEPLGDRLTYLRGGMTVEIGVSPSKA